MKNLSFHLAVFKNYTPCVTTVNVLRVDSFNFHCRRIMMTKMMFEHLHRTNL
jgi:hypothetical protein